MCVCVCVCVCVHAYIGTNSKEPPVNEGDIRNVGSVPGSEESTGGGHGNPPHYSRHENPMDRGS